jgi:hypothetical protein
VDSYQWYLNGGLLSGETSASITVGSALAEGVYRLDLAVTKGNIVSSGTLEFAVVSPAGGYVLSGVVRDERDGSPISGALVTFGSSSATTGADGSFSFDMGPPSGTAIRSWGVWATDYSFEYWDEIAFDTTRNLTVTQLMSPFDYVSYPTHAIDLTIQDAAGVEIPTGWEVIVVTQNSLGGESDHHELVYVNGGTNRAFVSAFGSDCQVEAEIFDDQGAFRFPVLVRGVDLSAGTTPLTLTEVTATSVEVTADAVGNMGSLALVSPTYRPVGVGDMDFSGATTISGPLFNPYGDEGSWMQAALDTSNPLYEVLRVSTSPVEPLVGSSFVLPAIDYSLGPDEGYGGFGVSYSAANGVLSFPEVSGANLYIIRFRDPGGEDGFGQVVSSTANPTLPGWLRTALSGATCDLMVVASASNSSIDIGDVASVSTYHMDMIPDVSISFALLKGGTGIDDGYTQLGVTF